MNQQSNVLLLNPMIATSIGVNESIILQQLYYWHQKYDFQKWIYNSYEDWQKQFSFWSVRTIRRIFGSLEKQGLILSKRSKSCKFYMLCKDTVKKFFINQDSPTCPLRMAKVATSYIYTENNQKISSYKKQISSKVVKAIKEESFKNEILEEEKLLAEKMKETWNVVFQCSPKPIKAYINKSLISKLCSLYHKKFNRSMQEWELYAKKINSSKFLMGEKETKNNFKAVFSWLIKEETVDSILGGAYGVGDRTLDLDNLDQNLKIQETEVTTIANEKVSQYLDQIVDEVKEEKEFKEYVLKMKYQDDSDRYQVKKHMEEVGKHYMYGGYITPSHVYYPDKAVYRKRLYKSYLMAKYLGIDEISLDKEIKRMLHTENNKVGLFKIMTSIKERISNISFTGKFDIAAITASDLQNLSAITMS